MKQVVVGAGEVGRAIAEVLGDVELRDVAGYTGRADVIHVCFPWSNAFEAEVRAYQVLFGADLTIIHSTVPIGTSRRLGAVHSPVTGRHPHLAESVRTFVKFFGGERAAAAAALFAGVTETRTVPDPETTEAGKLLQTLQFGWQVLLQKEAYRLCRGTGADPEVAYRQFNEAYTAGYGELGDPFRLPVVADIAGPIGGHCVIPNAAITPSFLADLLLELNAELQPLRVVA